MSYKPEKGKTFLIPTGSASNPELSHLFVIATEACDDGKHILVSASRTKAGIHHDPTCIIKAGEHSFIRVESFVDYSRPRLMARAGIIGLVERGLYPEKDACTAELLERISRGIKLSRETPRWAKDYFDRIARHAARRAKGKR